MDPIPIPLIIIHTLIDNVYTNVLEKEHTCGILVRLISDHQMYFCTMNENYIKPKTKQKYVEIEMCNQESLEKFKAEIANAEIYARLQKELTNDPNTNYKILSQIFEVAKNRHIPKKTKRFNKWKHRKECWITKNGYIVNVMRSPAIERLMVRGSQVTIKHAIHNMETRTLVMKLRWRAIKRWVPVVT